MAPLISIEVVLGPKLLTKAKCFKIGSFLPGCPIWDAFNLFGIFVCLFLITLADICRVVGTKIWLLSSQFRQPKVVASTIKKVTFDNLAENQWLTSVYFVSFFFKEQKLSLRKKILSTVNVIFVGGGNPHRNSAFQIWTLIHWERLVYKELKEKKNIHFSASAEVHLGRADKELWRYFMTQLSLTSRLFSPLPFFFF